MPLEDGEELLLVLEPELPPDDDEPDLLDDEPDPPEAPIAPVLPELPEPPELPEAVLPVAPELPDEPLAESEPPPLPQAASDKAAAVAIARTALRERMDACMRDLLWICP